MGSQVSVFPPTWTVDCPGGYSGNQKKENPEKCQKPPTTVFAGRFRPTELCGLL